MKANTKTILFSKVLINKSLHQWPIAVFATPVSAKTYAAYIKMAHSAGNVELVKSLDPKTRLTDEGALVPGVKFSVVTITYEPSPTATLGADDISEESPTE